MANRFEPSHGEFLKKTIYALPLLLFIIIAVLFIRGIASVSDTTLAKQRESLETALHRSISQCYAVEGLYPPTLDYIEQHYGLIYDKELFRVDYQPFGSNIFPDVTIIYLGD